MRTSRISAVGGGKGGRWACAGTSGGHMYPFGWNVGDPWRYVPLLRYCRESLKHRGPEMETLEDRA